MTTPSNNWANLGELIFSKRKELRLTQDDLADRVGYTGAYIGQIESGKKRANRKICIGIAEALDLDVNRLLLGYGWAPVDTGPVTRGQEYRQLLKNLEMMDMNEKKFEREPVWYQELTLNQLRAMKAAREAAKAQEEHHADRYSTG